MKHRDLNKFILVSFSKRVAMCLVLLTLVFTATLSAVLQSKSIVYAASDNHENACRQLIADKNNIKFSDAKTSSQQYKDCVTGYEGGYNNPNNNDFSHVCPRSTMLQVAYCEAGYPLGQKDKKAGSKPGPTPAEIKKAAEKACQPYKDQSGVSSDIKTSEFNSCVDGYTGQKNLNGNACANKNGSDQAACLAGYQSASDGKAITVGKGVTITPPADPGAGSGTEDNSKLSCESTSPLDWIICPVVDLLTAAINSLDTIITDQLSIGTEGNSDQPTTIFCNDKPTCGAYYQAWKSFRNIALGLMVLGGLIIVIAQALGTELLDAYTIRKTLPRLLLAALGITLSWPLMQFFVVLSNDMGYGVRHLIYQPFSSLGKDQFDLSFGGQGIAVLLGVGGGLVIGTMGLLLLAASGALAVFIAFMVLILRQLAITLLIIVAPIAIVSYILPNTQRVYKFWWEAFSKGLMMFPLIAAFIAIGRVFAVLSFNNSNGAGDFNEIIGFVAYFAPYFLIPATFKLAGGAIRSIGGFVNDRGRGGFDRLRQMRGNESKKNLAKLKAGERLEGKKWIPGSIKGANRFNEATKGVGTGWNGRYGLGKRGRLARGYASQEAGAEAMKSPGMQAVSGWNDVNRVLAAGMGDEREGRAALVKHLTSGGDDGKWVGSQADAEAQADKAVRAAKVAGGFTKANGIAGFQNMARDGTAIRDTDDLASLAATVGQGDRNNTFKYAAEAASVSRQVGRPDLAAASEPIGELAFAKSDATFQNGLYTGDKSVEQLKFAAWKSGAGGEVAYTKFGSAKGRAVRNDTTYASDILIDEKGAFTEEQKMDAAAMLRESEMAIEASYGKYNNRQDARKIINEPKRKEAYDKFMDEVVGRKEPTKENAQGQEIKRRDIIADMVGDRLGKMTPEQREQAERDRAAGKQEDENQP